MSAAPPPPPPRLSTTGIALLLDVDGPLVEIERERGAEHVPWRPYRILAEQHSGMLLEDSGLTPALHCRKAPEQHAAATEVAGEAVAAGHRALVLLEGRMSLELKPQAIDKCRAIAALIGEARFTGRQPGLTDDDVGEEAGFALVNRVSGISVRIGGEVPSTAAAYGRRDVGTIQGCLVQPPASAAS